MVPRISCCSPEMFSKVPSMLYPNFFSVLQAMYSNDPICQLIGWRKQEMLLLHRLTTRRLDTSQRCRNGTLSHFDLRTRGS